MDYFALWGTTESPSNRYGEMHTLQYIASGTYYLQGPAMMIQLFWIYQLYQVLEYQVDNWSSFKKFVKIFPEEFALLFTLWGITDLFYRWMQLEYNDFNNIGGRFGRGSGRRRAIEAFYKESGYQYNSLSDAIRDRNEAIINKEKKVVPKWYADWE